MHAGLRRIGRWTLGASFAALAVLAHAHSYQEAQRGGGQRPPAMQAMRPMHGAPQRVGAPPARWGAVGGQAGAREPRVGANARSSYGYGAGPMRVADPAAYAHRAGAAYPGGITPVSAETRPVPHPPADSPVRAGSIREDVARYNEERGAFRPFPRNGGEVPRPPMPSPYRN